MTLAAAILAVALALRAQETAPSEYQLKAAFLYNFAKFIEWPPEAFPEDTSPFAIGIIGQNPFGIDLERTVKSKLVNGHPFAVIQVRTLAELKHCHILFISPSERKRLPEILNSVRNTNVLTVSEVDHFLESGGMINFTMEGNKVRFQIHDEAAKLAGLKISSKLLNLAKRTERGEAK